ncbi:hypothetical protein B0H16DRAFT_1702723 [Mycena metata]|uniref:BTB domain-containing protein n=1 Tax=Mycena metata TaxID=1033252 RepID=A0AAD7MEI9_9AGAR|nr:hypothetical protein B0H16DRAFT_1702723 [Mycena metata]
MAAVLGKRHSRLYFADGTFTLKAEDGTYYNVNRELLILKSDFFCGMLSLPIPGHPPLCLNRNSKELLQKAKEASLDGTSDETAVKSPPPPFYLIRMRYLSGVRQYLADSPSLDRLCALLKTCDFYAVESGMEYATYHLENHPDLRAALRYQLASTYHIAHWAHRAFHEMMSASILDLSLQEEAWLGWDAYRVLVRTHAEVAKYRLTLAFFPPDVVHAHFCYDKAYCQSRWEANWVGLTGGLGTLLMDEVSGAEMHDGLSEMEGPGMTGECRLLTITSIQDTPSEKSLLRKEEQLVETAVEALIKTWV